MRISPALASLIHRHSSAFKPMMASWRLGAYHSGAFRGQPIGIGDSRDLSPFGLLVDKHADGRLAVSLDRARLRSDSTLFSTLWKRAGVFIDLISDPDIPPGSYPCDLGDDCRESGPILTFCSSNPENVLVPDRGFYLKAGYSAVRRHAAGAPPFHMRDDAALWRGSLTGVGSADAESMLPENPILLQRVRLCLAAREIPATDIKIAVGKHFDPVLAARYRRLGIAGNPVREKDWTHRKFAIDIDGNSNAFSNLYIRLLFGCCVIKVASPFGYRQWYYDKLLPWTHYVPVEADLSDLADKISWCHANEDVCQAIAGAGQRLALSMTPGTERRATVQKIVAAYQR